jgi:hypothetical protein
MTRDVFQEKLNEYIDKTKAAEKRLADYLANDGAECGACFDAGSADPTEQCPEHCPCAYCENKRLKVSATRAEARVAELEAFVREHGKTILCARVDASDGPSMPRLFVAVQEAILPLVEELER